MHEFADVGVVQAALAERDAGGRSDAFRDRLSELLRQPAAGVEEEEDGGHDEELAG